MKKFISLFSILILCFTLCSCDVNKATESLKNVSDASFYSDYDFATNTITKGTEYSFGLDEWNMYVATAISNQLVRIVKWQKNSSDDARFKEEKEIGVYAIDDPVNQFIWIDDEHSSFYMKFQDNDETVLKNSRPVAFSILAVEGDKNKGSNLTKESVSYVYNNDDFYSYRAVLLSDSVVKIEVWRCHKGILWDKTLYAYDISVVNTDKTGTDFAWTDDEHTSFSITMIDPENESYWKEEKKVYFIIENENGNSQSIEESENRKDASTENDIEEVDEADLICVPMASMDFEGLFYEDVVQMFENAGFSNINVFGREIEYTNKVEDGSVVIVSIDDKPFESNEQFSKDAKIIIGYRIIKPQDEEVPDNEAIRHIIFPDKTSKLGKDLESETSRAVYYLNVDGKNNKPKLSSWENVYVTDGVEDYLLSLIDYGFEITILGSQEKEPYSGFNIYESSFEASNGYISWTMYLTIQKEDYIEYQFEIYPE